MYANENTKFFFIGTMITSFIGGILLLFTGFAGWNWSNYYYGIYEYGSVGPSLEHPLTIIPFLFLACLLFYCTYVSYLGFSPTGVNRNLINRAFYCSVSVFIIVVVGALFFVITIISEDVWWWFDAGFYGGFIGSGLSTFFLFQTWKVIA